MENCRCFGQISSSPKPGFAHWNTRPLAARIVANSGAVIFDMSRGFVVYLFEEKMNKKARILRGSGSRQKRLTVRKRALFFCIFALIFGFCGSLFAVSCGTTATSAERETISDSPAVSAGSRIESDHTSNTAPNRPESQQEIDDINATVELEWMRTENSILKAENSRLRSEAVRLNEALAEAGRTIYSLNKKLEAIFKPETGGD